MMDPRVTKNRSALAKLFRKEAEMERPADTILKAMYRLAKNAEKDDMNVLTTLLILEGYQKVLTSAFLVAKNDRASRVKVHNVILDANP